MKKRWNFVDSLITFTLVCAVAAAVCALLRPSVYAGAEETKIVYTAQLREVRAFTTENIKVGDTVFDAATGGNMGTVTSVTVAPHAEVEVGADGEMVMAEKPDYFTVDLVIEGMCVEKSDSYYLGGLVEFKAGTGTPVNTKYLTTTLYVTGIDSVGGAV
ncbi:MAG: DUF4330 family protein [Oscillospiraceae bacterium]|nr:DUF4330 family protein [Oscillospiraceae bacterium]